MTTVLSRSNQNATKTTENPVNDITYSIDSVSFSFKSSVNAAGAASLKSDTEAAIAGVSLSYVGPEYDYTFTLQTSKTVLKRAVAYLKGTNKAYGL